MAAPAVLITGGTTGIGRATAETLHERGFRVMVTGQNPDTIAEARRTLPSEVVVVRADLRSLKDADALASDVRDRFGALTGLFLNAGISRRANVESIDEASYDEIFDINTKGQFFTLQKLLPALADGGSIVFTIGIGVTMGMSGGSVAAASRGALLAMIPSLALELAPRGIRVNGVSPGAIETPIWSKSGLAPDALISATNATAARIPMGRLGSPSDVANLVAFLMSDQSPYLTGETVVVGGGMGLGS